MPSHRCSVATACAAVLVACAPDVAQLSLPPLDGRVASWVIARHTEVATLYAADPLAPLRLSLEDAPLHLELVAFSESLADLGLAPGPLPAAVAGGPSRALPDGIVTFAADVDAAGDGAWAPSMTSPSFREHRLPDTSPCREFHPEVAVLPTTGDVTWAASESPDSIIFGSPNGKVMRLRTGGEPTVLRVVHPMGTPPPSPRGGLRDAQGRLWLGDTDGGLWLGTVDGDTITLERRVGPTAHGQVNTIDGDPNRPEDQLFVMTSSGTIAQLAGDRWVLLDQLPTPPHSDNNNTLVWMGRDELFAGSSAWPAVRVIRGPAREDIHFEETGPSAITGISRLGPREAAAGLSGGWVLRFVDEHWTSLGRSELTLDNHVFYRAGGAGFIYTGAFGYVAEWHPTAGFCPAPASPQAGATVHYVVPLGDALFLSGDEPRGNNPTAYTLLRIK